MPARPIHQGLLGEAVAGGEGERMALCTWTGARSVCVMYASNVDGDMEECGDGDVDGGDMNQGDMDGGDGDVEEGDGDMDGGDGD